MYTLFVPSAVAFVVIFIISIKPIFEIRKEE